MLKRLILIFTLICMIFSLGGCHFSIRDTVESNEASLPPLRIDSSLVCSIESIDGNRLLVLVLEGNSNYDKDDELYVTYETVAKDETIQKNDVISFEYNYVTDVAAVKNTPHIMTEQIAVIPNYVPPTTEAEDTETTIE